MRDRADEHRTYPVGQPPMVHFPDEWVRGCCQTHMFSNATLSCNRSRLGLDGLSTAIDRVSVSARLLVTIWTEEGSRPDVMEHEEAHRAIAQYYYGLSQEVAARLATPLLGRRFPLSMTTNNDAVTDTLDRLQDELLAAIQRETADRCEVAQEKFDDYTRDQPPAAIPGAKERALAEEAAEYAARSLQG